MPQKKTQSWQDLKPSSKNRENATWRARLKLVFIWFKRIFLLAAFCAIAFGAFYVYDNGLIEKLLTPSTEELKETIYKTDGKISKIWAKKHGYLPKPQNLAQIDVKQIQSNLLKISQIKSADVAKIYPDKISIEIKEYSPSARVAIAQNRKVREYMLSKEGVIFSPVCIKKSETADLPWITGIPIIQKGPNFAAYPYAESIDELVKEARLRVPKNFSTWRTINARELGSITLPIMIVSTTENVKIVFHAKNIKFQLEKLEYILRFFEEEGLVNVEKIDLALKGRAIVSLRKNK